VEKQFPPISGQTGRSDGLFGKGLCREHSPDIFCFRLGATDQHLNPPAVVHIVNGSL